MKKKVMSLLLGTAGTISGFAGGMYLAGKETSKTEDKRKKMVEFYNLLLEWLSVKQQGKNLTSYFIKNNYKTVAIYGMKELGERLYYELKDSDIQVKYAIDKKADDIISDVTILNPDDSLEPVDVVVVTAIHYFDEIESELSGAIDADIVSLEDVVFNID